MRFYIRQAVIFPILFRSASSFTSTKTSFTPTRTYESLSAVPGADIEQEVSETEPRVVGTSVLYRGKVNEIDYCIAPADVSLSRAYDQTKSNKGTTNPTPKSLSLTQALNNASNRAVRRILLAKCWPSEEALNRSLRLAAAAEKQAQEEREASGSTAKCPVPRPILNLLMRRDSSGGAPASKGRSIEQYVADQISSFRDLYGSLPGFDYAEAYLESILSLATNGCESPRAKEVIESGIYDESYNRVLAVLKSVGVTLEADGESDRLVIATKLKDQDICLSMFDKISIEKESKVGTHSRSHTTESIAETEDTDDSHSEPKKRRLKFWMKEAEKSDEDTATDKKDSRKSDQLVVLCEGEPTMTRQLNALSNIVQRALLFGGDQELLVLSETLETNRDIFVERWYPDTGPPSTQMEEESRPGVQYLNTLILLLRKAYDEGVVTNLEPELPIIQSYSNAYERLIASLVELGSGYIRPMASTDVASLKPRTAREELGRFAIWEANFRASDGETSYPEDLEGTWEVQDEVGGETIGISTVVLDSQGQVVVAPPLIGLRWRLDPGPTHLDTCTFQVLGEDGTVLQYRGFIDRGARLEARFSKRPTIIRGSVMFQMRDGDIAVAGDDYWKDMLPINYKTGTTKFVMTKQLE